MALHVSGDALHVGLLVGSNGSLVHGEVNEDSHVLQGLVNHVALAVLASSEVLLELAVAVVGSVELVLQVGDACVGSILGIGELCAQVIDLSVQEAVVGGSGNGTAVAATEGELQTHTVGAHDGLGTTPNSVTIGTHTVVDLGIETGTIAVVDDVEQVVGRSIDAQFLDEGLAGPVLNL